MTNNVNTTNTMNTTQAKTPVVKMAVKFDQAVLETKQQEARDAILNGKYTYYKASGHGQWSYPAIESYDFPGFDLAVEFVAEMAAKGRVLSTIEKPFHSGFYYKISFVKCKEDLEILFAESDAMVAAEYAKEIESFNAEQVALLTEQLVAQELAKEEKKEQARLQSIRDKAAATAAEFVQSQLKEGK